MAVTGDEQGRLLARQRQDVADIGRSGMFDTLLQLACDLSGAPGAAIHLAGATSQTCLAALNLPLQMMVAQDDVHAQALFAAVVARNEVVELADIAADPCLAGHILLGPPGRLRYCAGFPVRSPAGLVLGTLCLADTMPHRLQDPQKQRLLQLAGVAAHLLEAHRADHGRRRMAALLQLQSAILQQAAIGKPLRSLAEQLIHALESHLPGARGALMTTDATGALRWLAGPSLPAAFAQHGAGRDAAPAGPADARGRLALPCTDTSTEPGWIDQAAVLASFGIAAVRSVPLFATGGAQVGNLAMYFEHAHAPTADEDALVELVAGTAAIIIERDVALRSLIESERRLKEAQEIARLGAYSVYPDRSMRTGSPITNEILGLPRDLPALTTDDYNRMIHPDDLPAVLAFRRQAEQSEAPLKITYRIRRRSDGALRWIEGYGLRVRDAEGTVLRYAGVIQDVTERRLAEQALRLNQRAVDSSSTGIVIVDAVQDDMPIIHVNPAFERLTGYARQDIIGGNCRFLQGSERDQPALRELRHAIRSCQDGHALLRNFRKDGTQYWVELHTAPVRDEHGTVTHFVGFQNDCTDRIRSENALAHQAGHDSLTGLANRSLLQDRLEQAVLRSQAGAAPACHAVTFIDLDHFKLVNDSLGHAAGDLLLKECAQRIAATVPRGDTVARMGGDEFVILLHDVTGEAAVLRQIDAVLAALNAPFMIDGHAIAVSASAGVALYPAHGPTASALLRHADIAMYDAKSHGRAGRRMFSEALRRHAADTLQLKKELATALAERQFCLHYQPKIHARTGELVGFEALVRWNHPGRGLLYPGSFIDAAEGFGLIDELGAWVMEEACRQTALWHRERRFAVSVAVNVSAAQFRKSSFLADVERILAVTGLQARFLELEITESLVMESPEQFIHILAQLHRLGITISVDDFGTGYSSLSFVKQFPIDYLKIDRSFVNDISTDPSDAAICDTIITMAHNLGLLVTAEGVETVEQATFLRAHGCDILQGFLISKPLPAEADFGAFPRCIGNPLTSRRA